MIKNILYIIPRLAQAGTEKHLMGLAENLAIDGRFNISICCLFGAAHLPEDYCHAKLRLIYLRRRSVYDLRIILDLYRLMKKEKYHIVHAYLFSFQYLAAIAAKLAKVPLIISSRRELAQWKQPHHLFLENLGNLFTDKVVACSESAKLFALKTEYLPRHKILTIYNGIDVAHFSPGPKDKGLLAEFGCSDNSQIIGMVANFSRVKDHQTLLKALVQIRKRYNDIKCFLSGDGYLREEIEKGIRDLGLGQNVILTGRRSDIARIFGLMDVFVLTSLREGLPNAVLEAMSCGLPVVATNTGGIPEAVENGRSGILVEPGDDHAVAEAVIKLLDDEQLRKQMAKRGREIAQSRFRLERMVKDYLGLYNS